MTIKHSDHFATRSFSKTLQIGAATKQKPIEGAYRNIEGITDNEYIMDSAIARLNLGHATYDRYSPIAWHALLVKICYDFTEQQPDKLDALAKLLATNMHGLEYSALSDIFNEIKATQNARLNVSDAIKNKHKNYKENLAHAIENVLSDELVQNQNLYEDLTAKIIALLPSGRSELSEGDITAMMTTEAEEFREENPEYTTKQIVAHTLARVYRAFECNQWQQLGDLTKLLENSPLNKEGAVSLSNLSQIKNEYKQEGDALRDSSYLCKKNLDKLKASLFNALQTATEASYNTPDDMKNFLQAMQRVKWVGDPLRFHPDFNEENKLSTTQQDAYVARIMPEMDVGAAENLIKTIMRRAADETEKYTNQGSTGGMGILTQDKQFVYGHVGDTPIVLYIQDGETGNIHHIVLNKNHSPENPEEEARVIAAGGKVLPDDDGDKRMGIYRNGKCYPDINVARSFGDHRIPGITNEPAMGSVDLKPYLQNPKSRVFAMVASDGVLRHTNKGTCEPYNDLFKNKRMDPKRYARAIMEKAAALGSTDDITVTVAEVTKNSRGSAFLAAMDGHCHKGEDVSTTLRDVINTELDKIPQQTRHR